LNRQRGHRCEWIMSSRPLGSGPPRFVTLGLAAPAPIAPDQIRNDGTSANGVIAPAREAVSAKPSRMSLGRWPIAAQANECRPAPEPQIAINGGRHSRQTALPMPLCLRKRQPRASRSLGRFWSLALARFGNYFAMFGLSTSGTGQAYTNELRQKNLAASLPSAVSQVHSTHFHKTNCTVIFGPSDRRRTRSPGMKFTLHSQSKSDVKNGPFWGPHAILCI
jgi:hypothetical protein